MNDEIAKAISYLQINRFRDGLNRALQVLPVTNQEVLAEVDSARHKVQSEVWDEGNTKLDWICWITYYLGRAVMFEDRNVDFRINVIKACAVMVSALDAEAKGWC